MFFLIYATGTTLPCKLAPYLIVSGFCCQLRHEVNDTGIKVLEAKQEDFPLQSLE